MNIELQYCENPTLLAYSTNELTLASHPICIDFIDEDGNLKKGATCFLATNEKHYYHQVGVFETRMFEIIRSL